MRKQKTGDPADQRGRSMPDDLIDVRVLQRLEGRGYIGSTGTLVDNLATGSLHGVPQRDIDKSVQRLRNAGLVRLRPTRSGQSVSVEPRELARVRERIASHLQSVRGTELTDQ